MKLGSLFEHVNVVVASWSLRSGKQDRNRRAACMGGGRFGIAAFESAGSSHSISAMASVSLKVVTRMGLDM